MNEPDQNEANSCWKQEGKKCDSGWWCSKDKVKIDTDGRILRYHLRTMHYYWTFIRDKISHESRTPVIHTVQLDFTQN